MPIKFKCGELLPAGSVDVFSADHSMNLTVWGADNGELRLGYHKPLGDDWHDFVLMSPTVDRDDILLALSEVFGLDLDAIELISN